MDTLPWLTSILLTDIFAGLAVLAVHLLIFADGALRRWERNALIALIAFAGSRGGMTGGMDWTYSIGGKGVPAGGFMSEPQWKMRVATAWTCSITPRPSVSTMA